MSQQSFRKPLGIAGLLGLLVLVLSTSSYAQLEASGPADQPDVGQRA